VRNNRLQPCMRISAQLGIEFTIEVPDGAPVHNLTKRAQANNPLS
jgi:hypothetical protein